MECVLPNQTSYPTSNNDAFGEIMTNLEGQKAAAQVLLLVHIIPETLLIAVVCRQVCWGLWVLAGCNIRHPGHSLPLIADAACAALGVSGRSVGGCRGIARVGV